MTFGPRLLCLALALCAAAGAWADVGDDSVVQAREALRRKDRVQLATARDAALRIHHPLAGWVAYWELLNRLDTAQQADFDAFVARWPGSYVEDRLRNDWLLELGHRRDWANFRAEQPRFRMNDDREVSCYALLVQHLDGQDVRAAARSAWAAQREPDEGCALLASTLYAARVFSAEDAWHGARLALEANRPRLVRSAAALISPATEKAVADLLDNPARFLARRPPVTPAGGHEIEMLALMRLAAVDPEQAASQLDAVWAERLPVDKAANAWAHAGKQAALKLLPQAARYTRRAWQLWEATAHAVAPPPWADDLLAWQVRAALREPAKERQRWPLVRRAIDAMSATEQREPAWVYWRARAQQALAKPGTEGDAERAAAQLAFESIARPLGYYNRLAAEEIGLRPAAPAAPAPLTPAEREAPHAVPGLVRAMQLIGLGLRSEGVREWNYTLRGLGERELLAAAHWACQREVWDRCIATSERTRGEIDINQRYPLPWRDQVVGAAGAAGLDPAVVYGLIRQESRFVADIRSSVGARGLMQLMPATAKWMARKLGVEYRPAAITDLDLNLQLGGGYLRRVLDNFDGSLPMAAAAYNAGPSRVRRWREGPPAEAAAWVESIPFNETRDYVKKVLANAAEYAALLGQPTPGLKTWLGPAIGPRNDTAGTPDRDLP